MNKNDLNKIIGDNLRLIRVKNQVRVEQLAKELNCHKGFIYLLELGRRTLTTHKMHILCNFFNTTADYFFQQSEEVN